MSILRGETPRMIGVLLVRLAADPVFDKIAPNSICWRMVPVLGESNCTHVTAICTACWRCWQSKYQIVSPSQFQSQEYEYAWN